jgi:trigger factor
MQVSVETTNGLERRMKVAVPKENIDTEVEKRLKSMVGRARIAGFRPGKVPFNVIRQKFGKQVRAEVTGEVVQSSFYEAVIQEKLRPAGTPHIEPDEGRESEALEFTAVFEVYPEIEIKDLETIAVERPQLQIGDTNIDKMLETLRKQRLTWQVTDRVAQEGDQVVIDFVGTIEGEEFSGGAGQQVAVKLGAKQMISGFEEQLVGAKAGEERTLSLSFPEDYHSTELAGRPVQFAVAVHRVEEPMLPELDDDFVTDFGIKKGGLEALRQQVRENMLREAEQKIASRVKEQLFQGLMDLNLLEVPGALVDSEIDVLMAQRGQAMQQYGGGQVQDMEPGQFEEQARRRVALGLILAEVIQQNKISVPPARLREKVEKLAGTYERPDDVIKYYYSDKDRLKELENVVLEDMAVEWLLGQVRVSEQATSFDDLMNPGQTAG